MLKLARFLKKYKWPAVLAPLFMLLEVCMDLLQPRFMAAIVNDGIIAGHLGAITSTAPKMLIAALIGLIAGVGCTVFATIASQNFGADLRQELFQKIQSLSLRSLDRFGSGSIVTRLTGDITQIQNLVLLLLRVFARDTFMIAGSMIMAFTISPRLSIILLAMIPLLAAFLVITTRITVPLFAAMQQRLDQVNTVMQENLAGIRVVKAFVRSDYEEQRFQTTNSNLLHASLKAARIVALNTPLMSIILNFSIVAALWYGGILSEQGALSVGSLAAFLTYITQLLFSTLGLGNQLMAISRAKASADRINEILELAGEQQRVRGDLDNLAEPISEGRISFEQVSFTYDGHAEQAVLHDIDFTAEPGETIGIVGVNGAGKSTLVSLIPAFYAPTKGVVRIDSRPIGEIAPEELRGQIGMVFQQAHLFSGTIRENICFGMPDASQQEMEAAAKAAEAHSFIMKLENGYDTELGQRGVNLSGGQKQRLSIARTLLLKPKIVILDDCTSAVDLHTDSLIRKSLQTIMESSTCLIIGQRIASVQQADRIIVLEEGRITAMGTHMELLRTSKLYQQMALSQQGA
ncbi:ATP-binding cassette subfamily B protein [Paenibacillus endophyticus]|uniref:ATP-binding cassette subfamily B protein n=1 Tax=Paenibacillus endophyticus TaxID=1294268 RepID=A0A7W5CCB4_9BACL|nr:ABC transporter ATP-binding protein [Paenibacillus endophyticus]MBB3155088.1 ATP-binding cassette subfamily B protein [Paenibacillus endophyticus]